MKRVPCFCLLTMVYHCLSRNIADSMYLKIRCEMAQWAKVPAAKTDDLNWSPINSHGGKRIDSCKVPLICTCACGMNPQPIRVINECSKIIHETNRLLYQSQADSTVQFRHLEGDAPQSDVVRDIGFELPFPLGDYCDV